MKIVGHSVYEEMYYLEWPDGSRSDDFYSKTRAKDHAAKITETLRRKQPRQRPLEARTEV